MPEPQCSLCKHTITLALHRACQQSTDGNCGELVAEFAQSCEQLVSILGGHVPPEVCQRGSKILQVLCEHIGYQAVCNHVDEIASMICSSTGICP